MEFPFIIEAYESTKSGDAILENTVVEDEHGLQNFKEKYSRSTNIKYRTKEIPSGNLDDRFRRKIISIIKERVDSVGSVSVIKTIKEVMSSSYAVYAPEIESISATIVKSRNFIRTKNGDDYYISRNPEKRFIWWQTFNNKWTPILAAAALAFSAFTFFNGRSNQRREELKTQELQEKIQSLNSTLQKVQRQIDYLLKEKFVKDSVKNGKTKTF